MNYKVFDGHNDTLLNIYQQQLGKERSFFEESIYGHLDFPRAGRSLFSGGFFAIFPPPTAELMVPDPEDHLTEDGYDVPLPSEADPEACRKVTQDMIDLLYEWEKESNGQFNVVKDASSLEESLLQGKIAAVLHFEGAEAVDRDLKNLETFYQQGLRSLGLVWSRPNAFATGVPYRFPSTPDIGEGLTEAGRHLVRKCNELGIMIDTSHLNEKGFWDVVNESNAPIIATHSNAHALSPISRNLTDDQITAIAKSKGVVGVTYSVNLLRSDGKMSTDTSLQKIIDHIKYMADLVGVDHVALGSDFDGTTIPDAMKGVIGIPELVQLLEDNGFSSSDVNKITHGNWLRVLKETWI
ncbi:dipeptidase [Halobacillus sp. A1]|uniref:dipeptidase n=1 Tax=Halobacillus sp. A1 TaxID=2880262 RepID=UPI0020A6C643|nr:dipeptidase [Halobacillus sp. A1]MCP3032440.1 dipeptidase [Halobacillus sp. A1]